MLRPRFTGAFKKDRKRAGRRGKSLDKLDNLMRCLASEEKLEARFRDHKLGGEWRDFRECHIERRTGRSTRWRLDVGLPI